MRLLYALALPVAIPLGLLQLWLWRRWREPAQGIWGLADLIGGIGALLIIFRSSLPWWVATGFANTLIVFSALMVWAGMRRMGGESFRWPLFLVMAVVFFAFLQGFPWIADDLGMRVLFISIALGAINAGTAWDLLRHQQREPSGIRTLLTVVFALHALFYLFRAATAAVLDPDGDFLNPNSWVQGLTLLLGNLKLLIWNICVILMLRQRRAQGRAAGHPPPAAAA